MINTENMTMMETAKAKAFVTAGNATFTLLSVATGVRYTYKVKMAKPNEEYKNSDPLFFVSLLTGPDNTSDYTYVGKVQRGKFSLTKGSKMTAESLPVKAFAWTLERMMNGTLSADKVQVFHLNHCGRCGRDLTTPESVTLGIGPECASKMGMAA
jgi:hypothetical protein